MVASQQYDVRVNTSRVPSGFLFHIIFTDCVLPAVVAVVWVSLRICKTRLIWTKRLSVEHVISTVIRMPNRIVVPQLIIS